MRVNETKCYDKKADGMFDDFASPALSVRIRKERRKARRM